MEAIKLRGTRSAWVPPVDWSDKMGKKRTLALVCVLSAAVLAATALADEPQTEQSMRPVDLKKDGFDITLQALPSGELSLYLAVPEAGPAECYLELRL